MVQVVFEDDFAGFVDGRADSGELNQHFRTVAPLFDHIAYSVKMPDGAGEAVEHGFGVCVGVAVITDVVFVVVVVAMFMFAHVLYPRGLFFSIIVLCG